MKRLFVLTLLLISLVGSISVASQSDGSCPAIVETALASIDEFCEETGRNQICYGNFQMDVTLQEGIESIQFEQVGDIADINDISSITMSPMDEEHGYWGVALMRLQTSLPSTLPGENVTFLLFGDVQLTNAVTPEEVENDEQTPMQAFYLTTGVGDSKCDEAPESGMLVQTPEGVGEVSFVVNEVEIAMGSTVLFQAEDGENLDVSTLEGSAVVTVEEETYPIIAGTRQQIPLPRMPRFSLPMIGPLHNVGGNLPNRPVDPRERGQLQFSPENVPDVQVYNQNHVNPLPMHLLQRQVDIQPPLNDNEMAQVREHIRGGQAMCGQPPFPPCDKVPQRLGGQACIFNPQPNDPRPPCDESKLQGNNQLPPPQNGDGQLPPPPDGGNGQLPPPPDGEDGQLPPPPDSEGGQLPPPPNGGGQPRPPGG